MLAGIPLEGVWLNSNYMYDNADFTVNITAFPNFESLTDFCHANNQRVIPIIDGGISAMDLNKYILKADEENLLIKSSINRNDTEFIINHGN